MLAIADKGRGGWGKGVRQVLANTDNRGMGGPDLSNSG